jgi:hypothetical protein
MPLDRSGAAKSVQPAEYGAGLELAISLGWLALHEGGAFLKLTQSGADLFARCCPSSRINLRDEHQA